MLGASALIGVLDSMAMTTGELLDALSLLAGSMATDVATLMATNDADVLTTLLPAFTRRLEFLDDDAVVSTILQGAYVQRAFERHYGANGGFNRFLTLNDVRVHEYLRLTGMQIDSRNVFAPQVVEPVASYEVNGAGQPGTFAAGFDVDTSKYGDSAFEVIIDVMDGIDLGLRITIVNVDGEAHDSDVVVSAFSPINTVVAVPGRGVHVSSIIGISGGTDGDRVHVRSVVERSI